MGSSPVRIDCLVTTVQAYPRAKRAVPRDEHRESRLFHPCFSRSGRRRRPDEKKMDGHDGIVNSVARLASLLSRSSNHVAVAAHIRSQTTGMMGFEPTTVGLEVRRSSPD